ncbi:hypothetical protein [Luteibacter sp. UNCMF366Tsu5.1]|uniref:hypothetical protein n=1 Tax=Luteibacter sp. UNCMF366Tsu5.1 TaxID=1502758 RepID=UPI000908CD48|nr:hypothetical protein [Luteibacter sp. UNCMF366Tsu5.1]SFW70788.1 hypothetical protein SAMN02800691_3156 [Luteibacter sp. UNCMF366Tsu5.1]
MFRQSLYFIVFLVGLAVVGWVGAGYLASNPLGAAVAAAIGACYLVGAVELHRYRQATASLGRAVAGLDSAPSDLGIWLANLHPSLRNAVRLRIEGARAALPTPALTPYLVGLLVLLGMLGTLLGMMATLRGTGMALESATDLQAIRGSLAEPVKGLGFAFGTSIAGVATSAMLGLLSALCRRERLLAVQRLDVAIATLLRSYSQAHQREEAFRLLQQQSAVMPTLVERLEATMAAIERQSIAAAERQLASQEAFHARTEALYQQLASSVERSLKQSIAEGVTASANATQPIVEATMAALSRETAALHDSVTHAVQRQIDGLSGAFQAASSTVETTMASLSRETAALHDSVTQAAQRQMDGLSGAFQAASTTVEATMASLARETTSLHESMTQAVQRQVDGLAGAFQTASAAAASQWKDALADAGLVLQNGTTSMLDAVRQSQNDVQATLESHDRERLAAWTEALSSMADALSARWTQTSDQFAQRQNELGDALASTTRELSERTQAQASHTITEVSRLVEAATEAPRIAAEVVAELREKLSDSMLRDTAMLEERSRLLATLETLLDAVNHASTEQRTAVDALVATSADLLDRVGNRFTDHVEAETGKLEAVAAQLTGSAVEVASLGEAFGTAVTAFGQSNEALMERLDRIAGALDASLVRSDEQLAYYVAQAREVVDLSVLSQKQIIEDMQRLAGGATSA